MPLSSVGDTDLAAKLASLEERLDTLEETKPLERLLRLEEYWRPALEHQRQRSRDGEPDEADHQADLGTQLATVLGFGEDLIGLEARISSRLQEQLQAELQAHEVELSNLNTRFLAEMDNLRATTTAQNAVTAANLRLQIEDLEKKLLSSGGAHEHKAGSDLSTDLAIKALADHAFGADRQDAVPTSLAQGETGAFEMGALEAKDLQASSLKSALDHQAFFLASHEAEIKKLKEALSYDAASKKNRANQLQLQGEGQDEEGQDQRRRPGELQVLEDRAEWNVLDVMSWKASLPKGQAMDSPPFNIDVPGLGKLQGLILRFYPSGGRSAWAEDTCSLYLVHPFDMPWAKYELYIGGCIKGPFDPIYGGSDDFCSFSGSLDEDEGGEMRVLVGVKFLPPGISVPQGRVPSRLSSRPVSAEMLTPYPPNTQSPTGRNLRRQAALGSPKQERSSSVGLST